MSRLGGIKGARRLAVAAVLAGAACSEFSASPPPVDDGGIDGGVTDAGATDAGATDAGAKCVARAPSCEVGKCMLRTLSAPASTEPWGITATAQHVFWIAQSPVDGGGNPKAGYGRVQIVRAARTGDAHEVLADDQDTGDAQWREVTELIAIGDYVYWWVPRGPNNVFASMMVKRVKADCQAPCDVELVHPGDALGVARFAERKIVGVAAAADDVLFVVNANGELFRLVPSKQEVLKTAYDVDGPAQPEKGEPQPDEPAIVATPAGIVVAARSRAEVIAVSPDARGFNPSYAPVPAGADVSLGLGPLAADCDTLFGVRSRQPDGGSKTFEIWSMPYADKAAFARLGTTSYSNALSSMRVDEKYLYARSNDALLQIDKTKGTFKEIVPSGVRRFFVDDLGVYWTDHKSQVQMLVK